MHVPELWSERLDAIISGLTLATALVLTSTFLYAFLQPSKTIVVSINSIGEAYVELPLVILIVIGSIRNLRRQVQDVKEEEDRETKGRRG